MNTKTPKEINLGQFTGTTQYFQHRMFPWLQYTDGIQYMQEVCEAHWLGDAVGSWIPEVLRKYPEEYLIVFDLEVVEDEIGWKSAVLYIYDDTNEKGQRGEHYSYKQNIEYTDFPLEKITIYAGMGGIKPTDWVIMLPREK